MRSQLSSRALALAVAGANVVVCCALVSLQFMVRPEDPLAEAITSLESFPETVDTLEGYQRVTGPAGMTTHIPVSWPTKATRSGATQADDPTGTSRLLRYGGSATPDTDSYQVHADFEREFSRTRTNYVSLRLERTAVRGMSAIDWEFEYDAADGRQHVRSVYWLVQGFEYFVYASAPVALWPRTQDILDVMLDYSTP